MSILTSASPPRADTLRPGLAALLGGATFAAAMVAGAAFDLNADSGDSGTSAGELALYAAMVLVAAGLAVWLGARALSGPPSRLARTAIGLAVLALLAVVAFWSGWPHVVGAVALVLALEHRRRVGSFSAATLCAAVLAGLALVAATYLCLFG